MKRYNTIKLPKFIEIRTPEEIAKDKKRTDYAINLGLIGVFDEAIQDDRQKRLDKAEAMSYILSDKPLPEDLLRRILKYKAEDEEEFKKIKQEDQ